MRKKRVLTLVALVACLFVNLDQAAGASWTPLTGQCDLLALHASPVGEIIKGFVGQFFSLMMLAVAVVIGLPLVIAALAFSASYVFREISARRRNRHHLVAAKAPTTAA